MEYISNKRVTYISNTLDIKQLEEICKQCHFNASNLYEGKVFVVSGDKFYSFTDVFGNLLNKMVNKQLIDDIIFISNTHS